jgi:hypothetical protein
MRIDVDCSCFLETSTHLQETKLKIVVLLSRVERDKTLGEIVNSQLKLLATMLGRGFFWTRQSTSTITEDEQLSLTYNTLMLNK